MCPLCGDDRLHLLPHLLFCCCKLFVCFKKVQISLAEFQLLAFPLIDIGDDSGDLHRLSG
ncbi:hypothetical protein RJ53_08520 [Methanocalculus chunghsingensis]|uniref:Uncharacterized protein n=1 Tax=Methanocalculus chunghsingensis TaxID=156457 RepID=A0A8J7WAS1_9EURY|nr:hypothetical protein [Methanocalculus chunghsingensis]